MTNFFKYLPENILSKKIEKGSFPFSQYLFWDTAIEKIDTEKHKNCIDNAIYGLFLLSGTIALIG